MRSRLYLLAVGGMVAVLATCSTDRSIGPSAAKVNAALTEGDVDVDYMRWLADQLFGGHSGAMNQLEQMINSQPATPARINGGVNVIDRAMEWLATGLLNDPEGPLTPETGMLVLVNMVNAYIGREDQVVDIPEDLIDYAIEVIDENTDRTILTNLEDAGVKITPGTVLSRTILTIIRQDGRELNPPVPAKSAVFDVTLTPMIEFLPFTLALCANEHMSPAQVAKALIYHYNETTGEYDALVRVPAPTELACLHSEEAQQGSASSRGWFASIGNRLSRLVSPNVLYAGHAAIAGTVRELSPFIGGAPDQLETELSLTLPDPHLIFGYNAPIAATLTSDGDPVSGQSIELTVDGVAQTPATTGSNGVASWSYSQPRPGDIPVSAAFQETDDYLGSTASGTLRVRYTSSPGRVFTTPIPNSQYASNRTIPFKFQLYRWTSSGWVIYLGGTATLRACKVVGGNCTPVSLPTGAATTFRANDGQYILNFDAKLLGGTGTYRFTALLDDTTELGPVPVVIK